jgi:hypothetical protein
MDEEELIGGEEPQEVAQEDEEGGEDGAEAAEDAPEGEEGQQQEGEEEEEAPGMGFESWQPVRILRLHLFGQKSVHHEKKIVFYHHTSIL